MGSMILGGYEMGERRGQRDGAEGGLDNGDAFERGLHHDNLLWLINTVSEFA